MSKRFEFTPEEIAELTEKMKLVNADVENDDDWDEEDADMRGDPNVINIGRIMEAAEKHGIIKLLEEAAKRR